MTPPRHVVPGQLVFITRRCHRRRFGLRPSKAVNQLFLYLLALMAWRFGIEICAVVVMSSHTHYVLHDAKGRFPDALQWLHSLGARALNAWRHTADSLWSGEGTSVAHLADADAVVDKIAYTLANPVRAGAVEHGRDWDGIRTTPEQYAAPPVMAQRPAFFFRQAGKRALPKEVPFRVAVPPTHAHLGPEGFGRLLAERVATEEALARAEVRAKGQTFQGPEACCATSHEHRPEGPGRHGPGTGAQPVIARDPLSGAALTAALDAFQAAYAETRALWLDGRRGVLWPSGTWMMVRTHRLRARPPP